MMMTKRFLAFLLSALLLFPAALADPLPLEEDLSDTVTIFYNGEDDSDGRYVYTYRYPLAVESDDLSAVCVNEFYRKKVREFTDDYIPSLADYYAGLSLNVDVEVSYVVTCNNDEWFSVLIHKTETVDGETIESWEGNTFARSSTVVGSLTSLPKLLGILDAGESDEWLEDRQSQKVWKVLCSLVWDEIMENPDGIGFYTDLQKEDLEYIIDPVLSLDQDFYMDEAGNLVFFILPGRVAPEDAGLITFSFSLEEIKDEL